MHKRKGSKFERSSIVLIEYRGQYDGTVRWRKKDQNPQRSSMVLLFEHRGQYDGAVRWRTGRSPGRDRDLATSDDAIPGAHEGVMRQRVKLIVRSSCGVTERSASSAARRTSNQEPNTNKTKRERGSSHSCLSRIKHQMRRGCANRRSRSAGREVVNINV